MTTWFLAGRLSWVSIALTALGIQVLYVAETNRRDEFTIPVVDAAAYHNQAVAIAGGETVPRKPFWQPPLYPYALGVFYRLAGPNIAAVRYAQALPSCWFGRARPRKPPYGSNVPRPRPRVRNLSRRRSGFRTTELTFGIKG